jgi:thiol-disulfide isomerase/thioredoxin
MGSKPGGDARTRFVTAVIGAGLAALAPLPVVAAECDADARVANLDFVVEDMHGENVRLGDYLGRVILLDFWATWCAPCRIEMPWFVEFFDEYEEQGFVVLAVNVDDPVPAMQSFADQFGMDFPVLVAADRDDLKEAYGPPIGYPAGFIIDREGTICQSHVGFTAKETFEQEIVDLL